MNPGNNDFDEETIKKAKENAKSFLENNYNDITSIVLEEPSRSPMGSITIDGKINQNVEFTISLDNDLKIARVGKNEGFPEIKEECKDQICDY